MLERTGEWREQDREDQLLPKRGVGGGGLNEINHGEMNDEEVKDSLLKNRASNSRRTVTAYPRFASAVRR